MRASTYPLEITLGMEYYASDSPGIGGRLRTTAEDFRVEEIPSEVGDSGPYLICRLTKKDWELQHALKELGRALGISHRRIGFAGTKDKHAVTTQLISLYKVSASEIEQVQIKDLQIETIGRAAHGLSLGSHQANHFTITIRDTSAPDPSGQILAVTGVVREGVPNYFGLQRFGVIRPLTHWIGLHLLRGDYEGAVVRYVGQAFPDEPLPVQEARTAFMQSMDPLPALRDLPLPMGYERAMLHHLAAHPGDYAGALKVLPPRLLSMFVSAFQSYLFNLALSRRLERCSSLNMPFPGDRLIFLNGREDRVNAQNQEAAAVHLKRGRCRIAIFMPGCDACPAEGPDDEVMRMLLAGYEIGSEHFCAASRFVRTRYEGALRPVSLSTEVTWSCEGNATTLSFLLPPGQYATTVCREYMKSDPRAMI